MRASELLGRRVLSADGAALGIVHDLRVRVPQDPPDERSAGQRPAEDRRPVLLALVVGPDDLRCRTAHAWGFAQGRCLGPAPLRRLLAGQGDRTRAVAVAEVTDWDDEGRVRVRRSAS